jgi:hypothetical protein
LSSVPPPSPHVEFITLYYSVSHQYLLGWEIVYLYALVSFINACMDSNLASNKNIL